MSTKPLQAPFPYFGGKSRIADQVWARLGDPANYVEPFAGSLAVLLARPSAPKIETVNDVDGMISNFWRSIIRDPEATAHYADWPVNENDLHARHAWLVGQKQALSVQLEGDPDFYDVKIAGWWAWGIACWIGSGWCSGKGPWIVVDGELVDSRQLPHLGDAGRGVNRQRPHLGDAGRGVNRKLPHLGDAGRGVNRKRDGLSDWLCELSARLENVRVCCGDWSRVCGPSVTHKHGMTAVFLDPPYADTAGRDPDLYAHDCLNVAHDVRRWAIENGDNPLMRIALCGYEGEHEMPVDWECLEWKTKGGYECQAMGERTGNTARERIWFSPACLRAECDLFSLSEDAA